MMMMRDDGHGMVCGPQDSSVSRFSCKYLILFQETFRSCADIAITESGSIPKSQLKKMEKLKKLYLFLKKNEKVKTC